MHQGLRVALVAAMGWAGIATAATKVSIQDAALDIDFDEAMVTWADARPSGVATMPVLPLACRWDGDTRLACRITGGARAARATRYRVDLPTLATQRGEALASQTIWVETRRPTIELATWNVTWTAGVPRLEIESDDAVSADAVEHVLRLAIDGRPVPTHLLPLEADGRHRWQVSLPDAVGDDAVLELRVVPGLIGSDGPLPGTQDKVLARARMHETARIEDTSCNRLHQQPANGLDDCRPGIVTLQLTRPLDAASLERFASVLPAGVRLLDHAEVDRRTWERAYELRAPGERLSLDVPTPRTSYDIVLPDGLRDVDGRAVLAGSVHVTTVDLAPALTAPTAPLLIANADAPSPARAVNVPRHAKLDILGLGAAPLRSTVALRSGAQNIATVLDDRGTRTTLQQGGYVRWSPDASRWNALTWAAPQVDAAFVEAADGALAWVHDWSGRPVADANAEVMLLGADGGVQRIAAGRTDVDGVADIAWPIDLDVAEGALDRGVAVLRVEAGGRRAVLPVGDLRNLVQPRTPALRTWGVTDRPLYRVGDTVHFRLWMRAEQRGRFARVEAQSRPLHLYFSDGDRVIATWTAAFDAQGASGDVVIPEQAADGTYCVTPDDTGDRYDDGACFFVGTYRAQDLWVQAKATDRVLRAGDRWAVDVEGGYYSGGAASGVGVGRVNAIIVGEPLESVYPQWGDYVFVDTQKAGGGDGLRLAAQVDGMRTDGAGRARLEIPIAWRERELYGITPPAFGRIRATASLGLDEREATVSNGVVARFARYPAFVGLDIAPRWFGTSTPLRLKAVVIDAEGRALRGRRVDVQVDYLPGWSGDTTAEPVAQCHLEGDAPAPCDVPRARSGRYRFTASSGDAAPTSVMRWVWSGSGNDTTRAPEPQLELIGDAPAPGGTAHVRLGNTAEGWPVLLVMSHRGRVVARRLGTAHEAGATFDLAIPADIRGVVTIDAYLRDPVSGVIEAGLRRPPTIAEASVEVQLARPAAHPVTLAFKPGRSHPGATVVLTLRNDDRVPREVALTVVDDAVRALAAPFAEYTDPFADHWLGDTPSQSALSLRSFAGWNGTPWAYRFPDPPSTANGDRRRGVPAPAPAPVSAAAETGGSQDLDRVTVTGSRIRAVDAWGEGTGRSGVGLRRSTGSGEARASGLLARIARVRGTFADAAYWADRIVLAPGETRRIEVALRDNLTRWRAVAWSVGGDEDFDVADVAIESGLPLEARLQAPVRLYPGDRATLLGNARLAAGASAIDTVLQASGAGVHANATRRLALTQGGQGAFALDVAPTIPGTIDVLAGTRANVGGDAVAGRIDVASPYVEGRRVQAGLIGDEGIELKVPAAPVGATATTLGVQLQRGTAGLVERWTHDLRDYPHRCWEQMLSRAIGAAQALARHDDAWPDGRAVIEEALRNAPVFQDEQGGFHYFVESVETANIDQDLDGPVVLTAWTVRGLKHLRALGYAVPARVLDDARAFLQRTRTVRDGNEVDLALAAASAPASGATLDALWSRWARLAVPGRVALARALQRAHDARADEAWTRLLVDAPRRGLRRAIAAEDDAWTRWMGSDLREQCGLVELAALRGDVPTRRELVAGLGDLYAGGVDGTDTQSAATCLIALADEAADREQAREATLAVDGAASTLRIAPRADRSDVASVPAAARVLALHPPRSNDGIAPLGYVAELRWREDARRAQASAVGFDVTRRYDVLRGGRWVPLANAALHEGDWVRIALTVWTSRERHFVAVTDAVPGGLQPTDLRLAGVAGVDLAAVSDTGSGLFGTRRLDPRSPRFYAEWLPAGGHEIRYFARVGNPGDFLAAPASVELMYGRASHARTAAERIRVVAASPPTSKVRAGSASVARRRR